MADRPILFSAPMVRALLDGRKTQTRRILKPQVTAYPDGLAFRWGEFEGLWPDDWFGYGNEIDGALPYRLGDRLWVKETWRAWTMHDKDPPSALPRDLRVQYVADDSRQIPWDSKTRVSIHMPRWASRLTLTVADVRVERLQDISEEDAAAEGRRIGRQPLQDAYPIGWYAALWDQINGPGAWEQNPWVVAVSFTVGHHNIDAPQSPSGIAGESVL